MTNLTNTTGYRVGITNFWDKSDYVSKNRTKAMKRFFLMYFIQQLLNGWFIMNGFLLKHTQLYKRAMRRILGFFGQLSMGIDWYSNRKEKVKAKDRAKESLLMQQKQAEFEIYYRDVLDKARNTKLKYDLITSQITLIDSVLAVQGFKEDVLVITNTFLIYPVRFDIIDDSNMGAFNSDQPVGGYTKYTRDMLKRLYLRALPDTYTYRDSFAEFKSKFALKDVVNVGYDLPTMYNLLKGFEKKRDEKIVVNTKHPLKNSKIMDFYKLICIYLVQRLKKRKDLEIKKMERYQKNIMKFSELFNYVWLHGFYSNVMRYITPKLHLLGIKKVQFNCHVDPYFGFKASSMIEYLISKLQTGYDVHIVFGHAKRSLNLMMSLGAIAGYKVCFAGRFTRKQIATYSWWKEGSVPFSDMGEIIDYSFSWAKSRHGVYGIKIWLKRVNSGLSKRAIKMMKKRG